MATLRSGKKPLRCFYCGRRSNVRYEGQKSFECSQCEATNWLDEDGDITDPPASTSGLDCKPVQYAVPRSSAVPPSSPPTSPDEIFCSTCLRNQHMLTSSLAQFEWPEDSNNAEYAARERKYWALRRDLEKRYPQVCAECAPKVESKMHEASYTAQTDHLRRMMDRTRTQRTEVKSRGFLDVVDLAGKWSWHVGFLFQCIWHMAMLLLLATEPYASNRDGLWTVPSMVGAIHRFVSNDLPDADRLMQWAIRLGMGSFLWNPRFKQTIRGFTAHILGFRQWYTYQLLILLIRLVCLSIAQYCKSQQVPATKQLGAQLVTALLMGQVFRMARRSIRTDTTPLFRIATRNPGLETTSPSRPERKDPNDLGSILDDILQTPSASDVIAGAQSLGGSTIQGDGLRGDPFREHSSMRQTAPNLGSLQLGDTAPVRAAGQQDPQITCYEEEMDWSPSGSQHRAFSTFNPYRIKNTNPRFSDTPIEPKAGPIWYKVPPAPTNPAQRVRNPPMRPIIRDSPKEKKENFFQATARGPVDIGTSSGAGSSDINLAGPKFFAPEPKDDPRDNLSSMFASSFSIDPGPDDEVGHASRSKGPSSFWLGGRELAADSARKATRAVELFVLFGALGGWIFALGTDEHYGRTVALASICACLMVSIRLAADLEVDVQAREGKRPSVFAPSLVNLALAQGIAVLVLMWNVWSGSASKIPSGGFGNGLFGVMIAHHMWHIFV
ncbi:Ima1 N-terminal domain-containing protein [Xylariaceae sp. FL0804]|nr:Ima1 N-terminal domain-containing protein [Xylariaceae sp. FL0804]